MKMPSSTGIDRPFPGVPSSDRYLAIGPIEDARTRICRLIERGEGLGVVIGPAGTGKTLLCQRIAAQYRATFAVVMLGDIRVSSRMGLIQQVLFHLRQPHQGMDEQTMQMTLIDCLTKGNDFARPLLLIIDEAQMLNVELLDEIRMLTNLIRDGRPLVQTILVGNPRLEDPLADPQLESLAQRIAARCYLHPMNHGETAQYVRSMLAVTGMTINDDAIASVYHACAGVPRLINQLMNQSLDFASLHRKRTVDDACVQHAWADLQQLPSPMLEPQLKPRRAPIEFGELDQDTELTAALEADKPFVYEPAKAKASRACNAEVCSGTCENTTAQAQYFDIESILSSPIVCLPDAMPMEDHRTAHDRVEPTHAEAKRAELRPVATEATAPVSLKTTHTTLVPPMKKAERKLSRAELFGIDFSDEMLVNVKLADSPRKEPASKPVVKKSEVATPAAMPMTTIKRAADPAEEEISLHSEILKMSRTAKQAADSRSVVSKLEPSVDTETETTPMRASLSWAPTANTKDVTFEEMPNESVDVPAAMAVVWSEDDQTNQSIDDRDILVIEDEVTVMVDPPAAGVIGSGALRQPPMQVERQYQNLFSRLRGKE